MWLIVNGQAFDTTMIAHSPNASTLGQYGEIPVSLFTGVPNIQIPIYDFSIEGHSFPIAASYHTSGIRLEQKPGWIGAGWSLSAGGSIVRNRNGGADEARGQSPYSAITSQGYFYNRQYLNQINYDWGTQDYIDYYLTSHSGESLAEGDDVEADEFVFDFLGYHGSFFMDYTGAWQIKSERCIRVDSMELADVPFTLTDSMQTAHTKVIKGFIVTGDDGVRYRFGYDDDAIDYAIPFSDQHESFWCSTAWHLTEVIFPSGTRMQLKYTRGNFTAQLWYDLSRRGGQYSDGISSFASHEPNDSVDCGVLISPSYLNRIIHPLGQILFYSSDRLQLEHKSRLHNQYDPHKYYYLLHGLYDEYHWPPSTAPIQSRALDSIVVSNNQNEVVRRAKFEYYSGIDKKLGLNALRLFGKGADAQSYSFGYYKRNELPKAYNTQRTDHWGYYRGSRWTTPSSLISERDAVDYYAGYGVLDKITYPTGGYTKFEYEPHRSYRTLNDNKTGLDYSTHNVGGCRIKKIINSPTGQSSDEVVSKEYFYVSDYQLHGQYGVSSGVLAGLPQYGVTGYGLTCPKDQSLSCTISVSSMMHSVFSGGVNSMGSHIGYSEVAERYPNGSYRIYKFSNYDNGYLDNQATAVFDGTQRKFVKFSSLEQTRGLLLQQDEYNAQDSLMKSTVYHYSMDTTKFVRGFYINVLDCVEKNNNYYPILEACTYKHYTEVPKLVSMVENIYSNGVVSHSFRKYHYNQYGQVSRLVESHNLCDSMETRYSYIWEMPNFNQSDFLRSPVHSIDRNIYHPSVGWTDWDLKSCDYLRLGANLYVPTCIYNVGFGNNGPGVDTTFCDYDSRGRLIYQTRNNGYDPVVYLWHNSGQYIVGIIRNATLDQVMQVLSCNKDYLGNMPNNSDGLMRTLRQQLSNALVTSYKYKPLIGMISETSPSGIERYYEYDGYGRLNGVKNDWEEYIETYKHNIAH